MRLKIFPIFEYTTQLLKKYKSLYHLQDNSIYRIIEIKPLADQYRLTIQIVGKSSIIECYPQEIVATDQLLEGFSKIDVRTITYLACNQIKKPKYKIITQELCENFKQMKFQLKETTSDLLVIKTANQIVMDSHIINNLSREEINSISYIAGYECSQNEILSLKTNID